MDLETQKLWISTTLLAIRQYGESTSIAPPGPMYGNVIQAAEKALEAIEKGEDVQEKVEVFSEALDAYDQAVKKQTTTLTLALPLLLNSLPNHVHGRKKKGEERGS